MQIPRSHIAQIIANAPRVTRAPKRHHIARLIEKLRSKLKVNISKHMQPCMILVDEAVQFFVHFERHVHSQNLTKTSSQFAGQVSRLRSDVIAIREVIAVGQAAAAAVLVRAFVEGVEMAMALAIDDALSSAYAEADDQTAFWRHEIGYGKIYPRVEAFLKRAGDTREETQEHIARHRAVKDSLSGHVHSARHSAMQSAFVPSISHPGMFHFGELGALSAQLPGLCLVVANETYVFSECCISMIIKPNPPKALENTRMPTGVFGDVVASGLVIRELLLKYGNDIQEHYEAAFQSYPAGQEAAASAI